MKLNLKIIKEILIMFVLLLVSCTNEQFLMPIIEPLSLRSNSYDLMKLYNLSGYYKVTDGTDCFGSKVAIKINSKYLSFFGNNSMHAVLEFIDKSDSSLVFQGIYKNMQTSKIDKILNVKLDIKNTSKKLTLTVTFEGGEPKILILDLIEKLEQHSESMIFAHRASAAEGVCFPAPENSLAGLKIMEAFGANGAEIDVRMTKDRIPVIFHDDNITPRTCDSKFCIGSISNFYFSHLRHYSKLYNGENIPTLEEMLRFISDSTTIEYVWLDMKYVEVIDEVMNMQFEFNEKAQKAGRNLIIYLGLPDEDMLNAYTQNPLAKICPSICEIGPNETIKAGSDIWAPRWTLGAEKSESIRLRALGIKTIYWPVNDIDVMNVILNKSASDGILTDYSPLAYLKSYEINNY